MFRRKIRKNIISHKINKIILTFKKITKKRVCNPWNVLSRIISWNRKIIIVNVLKKLTIRNKKLDE